MVGAGAVCELMKVPRVADRVTMLDGVFSLLAILGWILSASVASSV